MPSVKLARLYIFITINLYCVSGYRCPVDETVDITEGEHRSDVIIYKNVSYTPVNYFTFNRSTYGCVCKIKTCVPKCCPEGHLLVNKTCEVRERYELFHNIYDGDVVLDNRNVYYFENRMCSGDKVEVPINLVKIQKNGSVLYEDILITDTRRYCIDAIDEPNTVFILWYYEGMEEPDEIQEFKYIGMIISMPFLLATFLVYAFLPDRNLPAKALMCYVISLLFAYILLVTIQLDNDHENYVCVTLAFLCYFFFMASFFWMNASCLDIFFTFSGIRGLMGDRRKEFRRFLYYCAYAWGVPILLVCIVAITTFSESIDQNSSFYTGLGNGQCWFRNGWATGIYFYFPIAVLLITNIVLFGVTTYKIKIVQRDTKMLKNVDSRKHKYDNNDKQRFNLYVKLLFAMGINWSMEVVSWALLWKFKNIPDYVWVLTDFCNAVYGVFIFFIFVFKRNIWMLLKKRYLQLTGRPQQAHTLTSTHRTTLTSSLHSLSKSLERKITPSCINYNRNEVI